MRKPGYSAALSCVLVRAESAARELGSGVTGTEHLLLALAQEKISSVGKILICQGAEGRLLRCMLLTQPRPASFSSHFLGSYRFAVGCFGLLIIHHRPQECVL